MESIAIYLLAGVMAGFVSGLFGLGGGLTMVPALAIALPLQGVNGHLVMHLAIGTSLSVMLITAIYTTYLRHRRGDLDLALLRLVAPPVLAGALLGAATGDALSGMALRAIFIGFVGFSIARALVRYFRHGNTSSQKPENTALAGKSVGAASTKAPPAPTAPRGGWLWGYGLLTGLSGALMGMGAAILTVPFLSSAGYRIQVAGATAAALSVVIGSGAGLGYVLAGLGEPDLPQAALGYLYLPGFAGLAAGALIGSPWGVRTSHHLHEGLQFWLFLAYLCVVLVAMAVG